MNTHTSVPASSPHPSGSTEQLVGELEAFLADIISNMPPESSVRTPGRPRILPGLALWAGILVCVLRGFTGQSAVWRLLTQRGLWYFPRFSVCDQAVYARLATDGTGPLEAIFQRVRQVLSERLAAVRLPQTAQLAPFAEEVYALDESTLDQMARTLPALRNVPAGDDRLLPGKLTALFDIRRQQWHSAKFAPNARQNEKVAARSMVESLLKGSLILADLGYFAFEWFDWLSSQGFWWLSRLRDKTSFTVVHTFYQQGEVFDGIVFLGKYRADRAARAVRLTQFRVGGVFYQYITNVLDPYQLTPLAMAQIYARRWDIELAFLLVKQHLKLHLLWSAKDVIIQQQVWAVLIISQILQALRLEIAWKADADPFEVSMELLVEYAPQIAAEGQDPVALFVERGRFLRFIRPSRRTVIRAPEIPAEEIVPMPPDLILLRTEHHAHRKCGPRHKA
jgi:hypothetical protein